MSLLTYADLKVAVKSWTGRGTEVDASIDDIIAVAERRIYRELRVKQMETALSDTVSGGTIALPTGYVALKYAYINMTPVRFLERKTAEWIYERYPNRVAESTPKYIAREASTFIFGPFPDSAYSVAGIYYKRLDPIATSVSTIFTDNPDIYLFAGCVEMSRFLNNQDGVAKFEPMYQNVKAQVQNEGDSEYDSGSAIAVSLG